MSYIVTLNQVACFSCQQKKVACFGVFIIPRDPCLYEFKAKHTVRRIKCAMR